MLVGRSVLGRGSGLVGVCVRVGYRVRVNIV